MGDQYLLTDKKTYEKKLLADFCYDIKRTVVSVAASKVSLLVQQIIVDFYCNTSWTHSNCDSSWCNDDPNKNFSGFYVRNCIFIEEISFTFFSFPFILYCFSWFTYWIFCKYSKFVVECGSAYQYKRDYLGEFYKILPNK